MDLHISDVLKKYVKEGTVGEVYLNQKIRTYWEEEMSKTISSRTTSIILKSDELTIRVNSAPLRHELFVNRQKLIFKINEHLGQDVVRLLWLR